MKLILTHGTAGGTLSFRKSDSVTDCRTVYAEILDNPTRFIHSSIGPIQDVKLGKDGLWEMNPYIEERSIVFTVGSYIVDSSTGFSYIIPATQEVSEKRLAAVWVPDELIPVDDYDPKNDSLPAGYVAPTASV